MSAGDNQTFYTKFGLDPAESTENIAILLAGRDAQFDQYGVPETAPERKEVLIAYGILSNESARALYDEALAQHRQPGAFELEHLSNFGQWPTGYSQVQPLVNPFDTSKPASSATVAGRPTAPSMPNTMANPMANPLYSAGPHAMPPAAQQTNVYGMSAQQNFGAVSERPSAGTRIAMALGDGLLIMIVASFIGAVGSGASGNLDMILGGIVAVAYVLGFEVYTGATPVKHALGYTVRDVTTGKKLTLEQSAKRNWWRIVNIVPAVGTLVSFLAALVYATSIKPENNNQGIHDRMANAEVVRKNPSS